MKKALDRAMRALRSIMTGAKQFETLREANARLMLIGEVAREAIDECEEHEMEANH